VLLVPQLLPQLLRPLQPPVRQALIHCILQHQPPLPLFYNLQLLPANTGCRPHPPFRKGMQVEII
jgi:hypothetical protein